MLKKVLKYDLKYVYKVLIVFYSMLITFSLITKLLSFIDNTIFNILWHISSGITIGFIFSVIINLMMRLWARFVSNVYKDESYLTHTLPISKKIIYLSKFITSIVTIFTSVLVIILSLFIAYYSKENIEILKQTLNLISNTYEISTFNLIFVFSLIIFLEIENLILSGYTGIIIGHRSNNNKMLKSILVGFISYIATQCIVLMVMFTVGLFNEDLMSIFNSNNFTIEVFRLISTISIIVYSLLLIGHYTIDIKIFRKGVNVD